MTKVWPNDQTETRNFHSSWSESFSKGVFVIVIVFLLVNSCLLITLQMSQRSQVSGEAERNLVERNPWISLQTYLYICEVVWQMGSSALITSYIWLHHPAYSAPPPLAKLWSHTFHQSHPINCWALRCLLLMPTHFQQPFLLPPAFKLSAESGLHFLLFLRKRWWWHPCCPIFAGGKYV